MTTIETKQITRPGTIVITVGRAGTGHDGYGNAIYTTKQYRAAPRASDGVLTWRLNWASAAHRTAGKRITTPMRDRAEREAGGLGVANVPGVIHGQICP